jgi:hypothetical protein
MILRENLPKTAEVLGNYGVKLPDGFGKADVVNNWASGKHEVLDRHRVDLVGFSNMRSGSITESSYPADPQMKLKTQKWGYPGTGWSRFVMDLTDSSDDWVARFWLSHDAEDPNRWYFDHRVTKDQYRGKGFGNAISDVVDASMQELANSRGEEQVVVCDVEQVDVLLWFLRNGYMPVDSDSESLIDDIIGDDGVEKFDISSNPAGGMDFFIFKKGQADWGGIQNVHQLRESGRIVSIKLEKRFVPKEMPIAVRFGQRIRSLLKF